MEPSSKQNIKRGRNISTGRAYTGRSRQETCGRKRGSSGSRFFPKEQLTCNILEQSMLENMEKLGETLEFLMKQEENPEKLIQALDSLMKTKGRDGLAEILKEALDFLMKHKGREGLEDNLWTGHGVDSAKDASVSDEQRHASSECTPQPGPSAGTAENFVEAARNYYERLQAVSSPPFWTPATEIVELKSNFISLALSL
ncbi:hypothetical protein R1sor_008996 [Riccia sorocarpa]|uniref:Uncharacterized protein n=1 Tax=Riccia sorocarpa TaxID=122646 RepID=A0ABD3H7A3_9MARC